MCQWGRQSAVALVSLQCRVAICCGGEGRPSPSPRRDGAGAFCGGVLNFSSEGVEERVFYQATQLCPAAWRKHRQRAAFVAKRTGPEGVSVDGLVSGPADSSKAKHSRQKNEVSRDVRWRRLKNAA